MNLSECKISEVLISEGVMTSSLEKVFLPFQAGYPLVKVVVGNPAQLWCLQQAVTVRTLLPLLIAGPQSSRVPDFPEPPLAGKVQRWLDGCRSRAVVIPRSLLI